MNGVVSECEAVRIQQGEVQLARDQGLRMMTYGSSNDDVEWVLKQRELGINGVIVDDVEAVVAGVH